MTALTAQERALMIVREVGELHLEGHLTPHEWYKHIRYDDGKPDLVAIVLLSDIVYWYRPRVQLDESTGQVVGYYKRFRGDKLQRSHRAFEDKFGLSKKQVRLGLEHLKTLDLITTEIRDVVLANGTKLANVLFIEVNPIRIKAVSVPPDVMDAGYVLEDTPSVLEDTSSVVQDTGSVVQDHPSRPPGQTYTKTTPETTPKTTPTLNHDVVVALMALGLTRKQATDAVAHHTLTLTEVERWRNWLATVDAKKSKPGAVFAAAIRERRLPPEQPAARPAANHGIPSDGLLPVLDERAARFVPPELWPKVLVMLQTQVPDTEFETWIKPTTLIDLDDDQAVIGSPNIFVRQELEQRYRSQIAEALATKLGRSVEVRIAIQAAPMHGR